MGGFIGRRHWCCESDQVSAVATMPAVRGKLTAHAPLAPLVWFKSGGRAEWLFEPKDEEDLVHFLRDLDPDVAVMALGAPSLARILR